MKYAPHVVILLLLMNLIDSLYTVASVHTGTVMELNPLWMKLISLSPGAFLVAKMGVIWFACALLYKHWYNKLARTGGYLCVSAYTCLMFYWAWGGYVMG